MNYKLLWIFLLILQDFAASHPLHSHDFSIVDHHHGSQSDSHSSPQDEKVISVRVTSSVAVGRGNGRYNHPPPVNEPDITKYIPSPLSTVDGSIAVNHKNENRNTQNTAKRTDVPANLTGANMEYLKQLNAKKDSSDHEFEPIHPFQAMVKSLLDEYSQTDKTNYYEEAVSSIPIVDKNSRPNLSKLQKDKTNQADPDIGSYFPNNFHPQNNTNDTTSYAPEDYASLNSNYEGIKNKTKINAYPLPSGLNHYESVDSETDLSTKTEQFTNSNVKLDILPAYQSSGRNINMKEDPSQFTAKGLISDYNPQTDSNYEYDDYVTDIPLARKIPSMPDANKLHGHKINGPYRNTNSNFPDGLYLHNETNNLSNSSLVDDPLFGSRIHADSDIKNIFYNNDHTDDSIAEPSIKSVDYAKTKKNLENILSTVTVPLPAPSLNSDHNFKNAPRNEGRINPRLTTVSFNIVHDALNPSQDNEPNNSQITTSQHIHDQHQDPSGPEQVYEPQIYSQPSKFYSEPAKFYSEPAKIYSEPAKIYSVPAKVYSEPAKIYSVPSKFYSPPASLHLEDSVIPKSTEAPHNPFSSTLWQKQSTPSIGSTIINTTPMTHRFQMSRSQIEHQPEKNYEIDEKISVQTDGRSHGVQESNVEKCKQDSCKVGYVVEGRQYKKYRVEEKTPDGFIVGEYGVVRNEDGDLRGVRYTADSAASPRLIHDALMKFLQLK